MSAPNIVGVYWGAFDPPTEAHFAIMEIAIKTLKLSKLVVVINDNSYKKYTYSLCERKKMMQTKIEKLRFENIEIFEQNDINKINYTFLRHYFRNPIYAIAGYDAYVRWRKYSSEEERNEYDAIVVVPRGDDVPVLFDENAFLMPINPSYRYVSSTQVRKQGVVPK